MHMDAGNHAVLITGRQDKLSNRNALRPRFLLSIRPPSLSLAYRTLSLSQSMQAAGDDDHEHGMSQDMAYQHKRVSISRRRLLLASDCDLSARDQLTNCKKQTNDKHRPVNFIFITIAARDMECQRIRPSNLLQCPDTSSVCDLEVLHVDLGLYSLEGDTVWIQNCALFASAYGSS